MDRIFCPPNLWSFEGTKVQRDSAPRALIVCRIWSAARQEVTFEGIPQPTNWNLLEPLQTCFFPFFFFLTISRMHVRKTWPRWRLGIVERSDSDFCTSLRSGTCSDYFRHVFPVVFSLFCAYICTKLDPDRVWEKSRGQISRSVSPD